MPDVRPAPWERGAGAYAFAALGTLAAFALRLALADYLGPPFLLFYPAVVLAALFGGLGPGLFATAVSAILSAAWILPAERVRSGMTTREAVSLAVFTLVSAFLSLVANRYRQSLRRLRVLDAERARREVQAALRINQERLDLAVRSSKLGLWELDLANGQAWRTLQHDRIFGYETLQPAWGVAEALRHVVPEDRPAFEAAFQEALVTGHFHYQLRIQPAGQTVRWIAADGEVFRDADGKPVRIHGTVVDITERREMDERAARAERLTAVATLVRGMSHEINSPLASVISNVDFARQQVAAASPRAAEAWAEAGHAPLADLEEALADAAASADRVKVIVKDMTTFMPKERRPARRAAPAAAVRAALELAAEELRPCAVVTVDLPDLPDVAVSREELVQLFFSLLVNAGQATGAARNQVHVAGRLVEPGRVVFTVSDTGTGMSPFVLQHVFEPFFTTRGVGRGKGLGLPLCRGVVDAAGGELTLESAEGKGTTVTVVLPVEG